VRSRLTGETRLVSGECVIVMGFLGTRRPGAVGCRRFADGAGQLWLGDVEPGVGEGGRSGRGERMVCGGWRVSYVGRVRGGGSVAVRGLSGGFGGAVGKVSKGGNGVVAVAAERREEAAGDGTEVWGWTLDVGLLGMVICGECVGEAVRVRGSASAEERRERRRSDGLLCEAMEQEGRSYSRLASS
jgi:hypothetical protein